MDDIGYVMVTLSANTDIPVIGYLTQLDTTTDYTGKNVKPQIHKNFDGKAIT